MKIPKTHEDAETLNKLGFGMSVTREIMICCNGWNSKVKAHSIFAGDPVYWRREKGRAMGYCKHCTMEIVARYKGQTNIYDYESKTRKT